jgi:hypothetical protein
MSQRSNYGTFVLLEVRVMYDFCFGGFSRLALCCGVVSETVVLSPSSRAECNGVAIVRAEQLLRAMNALDAANMKSRVAKLKGFAVHAGDH